MTKKSKSKHEVKKPAAPKKVDNDLLAGILARFPTSTASTIDKRAELLAKVAGSIAAGLATLQSPSLDSASAMATVAVDIAEEILKKAGIPSGAFFVEATSPTGAIGVGAAS